jgi:hypothetical protein
MAPEEHMDLDDLFDLGDDLQAKVLAKAAPQAVDPTSDAIADLLKDEPEDCPYGSPDEPKPEAGKPEDPDLGDDIATRAKAAALAHDAFRAAKTAHDDERSKLQKETDTKLATLRQNMASAQEVASEATQALSVAMGKEKITAIPMTDRPDIKIKVKKGSKKGITRGWLVEPENIAVKAYEEALAGEPTFKTGKDFAGKLWDSQPKSEDSQTVTIPDAYEDEPDQ